MDTTAVVLVLFVLFAGAIKFLKVPRWARIILAVGFFLVQINTLFGLFEFEPRKVMAVEISTGHISPDFGRGVQALREAQMVELLHLLIAGAGLLVLILFVPAVKSRNESKESKAESKGSD